MNSSPIRMSATLEAGATALVKAILAHPMEPGIGKTEDGEFRPAHYITAVDLLVNGTLVAQVQTRTGISPDPLFGWRVTGVQPGDKIGLVWRDNQGRQQAQETIAQ